MELTKTEQEIANIYMQGLTNLHESLTNETLDKIAEDTSITESMIEIASAIHEKNIDSIVESGLNIQLPKAEEIQESLVTVNDNIYIINESSQDLEFVAVMPIVESHSDEKVEEKTPITENKQDENLNTDDIIQNIIDSLNI